MWAIKFEFACTSKLAVNMIRRWSLSMCQGQAVQNGGVQVCWTALLFFTCR